MFAIPPEWIPRPVTLKHYIDVWHKGSFHNYMSNSLIVTSASIGLTLLIGAPAAYGFAKYKYRFSGQLFAVVVAIRMFPPIVLSIPYYLMLRDLGLINHELGLIIVYLPMELTLVIWILEGFFRQIPVEIEEAADIDGLGVMGKFIKVALPLSLPALGVAALMSFILAWNEFLYALTLTSTEKAQTLSVGIAGYVTTFQTFWGQMSANGILYILPAILFTIFAQRGLVKGLTAGALKE